MLRSTTNKTHLYIHPGMPKAGSTSIQNVLYDRRSELLERHGTYYDVPEKDPFRNHYCFYDLVFQNRWNEARDSLHAYLSAATSRKANKLILSSEDLYFLPLHENTFKGLLSLLHDLPSVTASFVIVVRDL